MFLTDSIISLVCDYKKNNPDFTTFDISKLMNLHHGTIRVYLRRGFILGWCDYNSKEERVKSSSKAGKQNGKQVEIFKNSLSLGVFESTCELERQSEKIFGVKLSFSAISRVCLSKKLQYKGFIFKYI